jgi:putative oligomerization/nucleic acid binding protein
MEDPVIPERPGMHDAAPQVLAGIPSMPVIATSEQIWDYPFPLLNGFNPTIGWRFRPADLGGPVFAIMRRSALGPLKVVESFPLTEAGWSKAWRSLAKRNPAALPHVLAALEARQMAATGKQDLQALDARSVATLREVAYLGGYIPETVIAPGNLLDVRFLEDRLAVSAPHRADVLIEVPYGQVEHVQIGGPGLVRSGGGFRGGGFGVTGAIEGMAIAAVLNGLTTRTSIKTVVRIQGTGCELFLLHTKITPDLLRIEMSRALGAIRSAQATQTSDAVQQETRPESYSPVEELTKLADLLEKGLLTREEFDQMKARLLGRPPDP